MKKRLFSFLSICLILSLFLIVFVACGDTSNSNSSNSTTNKQVPIYQGMTISNGAYATAASETDEWDNGKYCIDNPEDGYKGGHWEQDGDDQVWVDKHGNKYWRKEDGKLHHNHHPGCQHGDYNGKDEEIDTQEVIEEQTEIIDEQIESTLSVIGSAKEIYYTTINQDVYITIKLSNPDSYEILSFVLNGNKYTSYMFEDGSDLENLILKVNVGAFAGIKEYTIDEIKYVDGTEIKDVLMNGDKTVKAGVYTDNMVSATISNETSTLTSIAYDVNASDNYSLIEKSGGFIKSYLYDGNSVIEKDLVLGNNTITFDNLTPNTLYTFANIAYYDDLTGKGTSVNILSTSALYTKTIVLFDNIEKTQTSISWDYIWDDNILNKEFTKLEVYKDDVKVKDLDTTAKEVDNLLSNNQYEIRATYKNVKDEDESISIFVTTLAKAVPIISVTNDAVTDNSIIASIDVNDIDGICEIEEVSIYKGDTLIETNLLNEINFDELTSYTNYQVKIKYTFNLNDGVGKQEKVFVKEYITKPYISVSSCKVANTSAISEGDTIYLQITIKNPNKVNLESVFVDGIEYRVASSTTTQMFVEIVYSGQFAGGDTELTIEKINYNINDVHYSTIATTNNSANTFINGKIEVLSIDYVNEAYNKIDVCYPSDTVYLLLTLNNPTGYDIDKINKATYSDINKIDDNHYVIKPSLENFKNEFSINSISYSNVYVKKEIEFNKQTTYIYKINDSNIHYISTANDLLNMNGGYYYELTNDIDLDGIEWSNPCEMIGIFDGKGYSIKNMSFVGTTDDIYSFGLFSSCNGIIKNLNIVSAKFILDITERSSYHSLGLICATNSGTIENCSVDQNSLISVNGYCYTGGICGASGGSIINCINSASVNLNGQASAGGIMAYHNDGSRVINCFNSGEIQVKISVGGLGGNATGVSNSSSSVNVGFIYQEGGNDGCLVGDPNAYSLNDGTCTIEQLNDKSFYIDTLGWDEDVWNLDDLDIENGKYPTLKQNN